MGKCVYRCVNCLEAQANTISRTAAWAIGVKLSLRPPNLFWLRKRSRLLRVSRWLAAGRRRLEDMRRHQRMHRRRHGDELSVRR